MVIAIVAILSVSLALSFLQLRLNARFSAAKTDVVDLIQKARSLSLSNILVNGGEPTDYYQLTISSSQVTLDAYNSVDDENIETLTLDSDFSFDTELHVLYFPPYGDVCFNPAVDYSSCDHTTIENVTTLSDSSGAKTATFTISPNGGYVEVTD
jgi:type II secretory pathway pseudopilin PulG